MPTQPTPADPRPTLVDGAVAGSVCTACGHVAVRRELRCERCLGEVTDTLFGDRGEVWAATTVHLRVGDLTPPFVLAYVDLDDGPRILAHVMVGDELPSGTVVRIVGERDGNLLVEAAS